MEWCVVDKYIFAWTVPFNLNKPHWKISIVILYLLQIPKSGQHKNWQNFVMNDAEVKLNALGDFEDPK